MILAIGDDQRDRREAVQDFCPVSWACEALHDLLEDEARREDQLVSLDSADQRVYFRRRPW